MAVLKRRGARWWLVLGLLVGTAACFVAGWRGREEPRFSHAVHGEDQGLTCVQCHSGARLAAGAGMPGPQLCQPCHERFDADKPPDRRLAAYFDASGRFLRTPRSPLSVEVAFSHAAHALRDVGCRDCHADLDGGAAVPPTPAARKDQCMQCHQRAGRSNECAECHREVDRDWVPATHSLQWEHRHGDWLRADPGGLAARCDLCHQQSSCQTCHREQLPRDHTHHWRRRGHGLAASIDRSRCSTCHRSDACDRCHESTRPMSHGGTFGAPRSRHCTSCHLPVSATGCFTCHKHTPSHTLAAPLPPGHSPAMNCRQCHGAGASMPHPDGGHACTACHR